MYKKPKFNKTTLSNNNSVEGKSIEQQVELFNNNKEHIKGQGKPLLYQERKDGVAAGCNIKTDRWEVAALAMDKRSRSITARREEKLKAEKSGTAEPVNGTEE